MRGLTIQGQGLNGTVGRQHDGATRGFVAATGLHTHVTVFHDIQAANTVIATQLVQFGQHVGRAQRFAVDGDDVALFKAQGDVGGLVRGRFRAHTPAPHVFFGFPPRIFQIAAFVRDVQQVGVHGVRGFLLLVGEIHRDITLFTVGHQLFAGVQIPLTPGGNHLNARGQRVGAQLETHLIVALAGGTVGDGVSAGLFSNFHQALGNQRARNGGAQQVLAFVDGIGAEHGEHIIAHEFFAQVFNVDLFHAHGFCLGAGRLHFFTLTDIGGERHHFTVVGILQPFDDN